jgi:hypothetical protein
MGGIAGGEKYIYCGAFFKFAVDDHGLYGSDELAAKAAGHELKGTRAILGSGVPGIAVTLQVIVEYLGFRLLVSAVLPIDPRSTLQYGSNDAGRTVHCTHRWRLLAETLSKRLRLKVRQMCT